MTNNPLDLALSGDNFQHEPTNTVEETNPNSMVWKLFLNHDSFIICHAEFE